MRYSNLRWFGFIVLGIFMLVMSYLTGSESRKMKNGVYPQETLTVKEITDSGVDHRGRNGTMYWEKVVMENPEGKQYHTKVSERYEELLPTVGYADQYFIVDGEPKQPTHPFLVYFMMVFGGVMFLCGAIELKKANE